METKTNEQAISAKQARSAQCADQKQGANNVKNVRKVRKGVQWASVGLLCVLSLIGLGMMADEGHGATLTEFFMQKIAAALVLGVTALIGRAMNMHGFMPDVEE